MSTERPKTKKQRPPPPPPTPPQPKPWDMPPLPSYGDPDKNSTYTAVGMALSQWESFEGQPGLIYGCLVGDVCDASPALRAYGVISGFSTRVEMLREASKAFFFKQSSLLEEELNSLLDDAKNFATRRNEIAHGIVQSYYSGGLANSGYALGPSKYAARKQELTNHHAIEEVILSGKYAHTSDIIVKFTRHFGDLSQRSMRIYIQLSELPQRP
jgi:hypothetical protein